MESNDSPEIPDRGETSDIPSLPSGEKKRKKAVEVVVMMMIMMIVTSFHHDNHKHTSRPYASTMKGGGVDFWSIFQVQFFF